MTMPASNNTAARRYLDLLRHVLCRDRFPDARYDMSSGSTWLVLDHLYPKVSPGGFVIIDDYALPTCKAAVDDFRATHSIHSLATTIDWSGIFWRK
jgi:Macrocin-O-methyltransferase (TylF)